MKEVKAKKACWVLSGEERLSFNYKIINAWYIYILKNEIYPQTASIVSQFCDDSLFSGDLKQILQMLRWCD